nr:ethylene-responsive transcription factor ERF088-like [Setaria viridis]XP_034591832.1 ethylene-responsive transcription factor ERF088-like [Setaria viridis]
MPGSVVDLARQATAVARADGCPAREAAVLPERRYRDVRKRGRRYATTLWNPYMKKEIWLDSYGTSLEAAYAYAAAARSVLGRWARPIFPELSPRPAVREVAAADLARVRRAPEPVRQQQPAPRRQVPLIR